MNKLKSLIPRSLRDGLIRILWPFQTLAESIYDAAIFIRHGSLDNVVYGKLKQIQIETQAMKDLHGVEKGLSLKSPKRPFGASLLSRMSVLEGKLDERSVWRGDLESAVSGLLKWNDEGEISQDISPQGEPVVFEQNFVEKLFYSRRSVRDFDDSITVSRDVLENAVRLAARSPSVCNRQAWKVRFIEDESLKKMSLSFQNGNAGFGDVPIVGIVSADLRRFSGAGERNQAWIDGGIFSMSLVLALHGLGVASCMLNMSVQNKVERQLKKRFDIPSHEVIIMQIAIGYARPGYRVARATKNAIEDIAIFVD
jgi:nitroreductase